MESVSENITPSVGKRASGFALLPFIILAVVYLAFSAVMDDLSKVPMTTAFIAAAACALFMSRAISLNEKTEMFARGMGSQDIMIMCLVFILAGTFTASAKAAGGVDSAVALTLHFIPSQFLIAGLFIVSALISLAVGTSCGTIAAVVPIAASLSLSIDANPAILIGATVGGAMFGDNLSLISDTTIAATRTQGATMKDKMIGNLKIVLVPAIVCAVYAADFHRGHRRCRHIHRLGYLHQDSPLCLPAGARGL